MQRRDSGYIDRGGAQDGATRQEAKRRFMDVVKEDMQLVCVTEEEENVEE